MYFILFVCFQLSTIHVQFVETNVDLPVLKTIEGEYNEAHCLAKAYFKVGESLHKKRKMEAAFPNFLKAKSIIERNDLEYTLVYSLVILKIADLYYYYGDYKKAIENFVIWHNHPKKHAKYPYAMYNTFALSFYHINQYEEALIYFEHALQHAHLNKRQSYVALIKGNIAACYDRLNDWDNALPLYTEDFHSSIVEKNYSSAIQAFVSIANHYAQLGDWGFYEAFIDSVNVMEIMNIRGVNKNLSLLKSQYHEHIGDYQQALNHHKRHLFLVDSLRIDRDRNYLIQHEFNDLLENKKLEEDRINQEKRTITTLSFSVIFFTLLVIATITLIFIRYSREKRNELKLFNERQRLVKAELDKTKDELADNLKDIIQKSEKIEFLNNLLEEQSQKLIFMENPLEQQSINQELLHIRLLTDENWNEFKSLFTTIYPNFLNNLAGSFGKLSYGEQRLACMIRLNLTTREMADMTGVSNDSVKKGLLRFKKKMNFDTQSDLTEFIFSLPV